MINGLHIFDLGVERYLERRREAEEFRLVNQIKRRKKPASRYLTLIKLIRRSV